MHEPAAVAAVVVDDALDVTALRAAIRASRLIGDSQLTTVPRRPLAMTRRLITADTVDSGGFSATRGFGVICHIDAIDEAVAKVPLLAAFVPLALDQKPRRTIRPLDFVERAAAALGHDDVNAVYFNVLVVPPGAAVDRHTDATLGAVAGDPRTLTPRVVAVLYVDVPDDLVGGDLRLYRDRVLIETIAPKNGRFVVFDGRLEHEVTMTTASGPRISCVAELYRLPRSRLRRVPRVRVQSNGFAELLRRFPATSPFPQA